MGLAPGVPLDSVSVTLRGLANPLETGSGQALRPPVGLSQGVVPPGAYTCPSMPGAFEERL